jgi:phosphoribosylformylglycinamidine synthase
MATIELKHADEILFVVGGGTGDGWLGRSLYLREIEGREEGAPPPVDLEGERRTGTFVLGLIETGRVQTCHDVADGGLLVAVAEMAIAGGIGASLDADGVTAAEAMSARWLFGEDQGRFVIAVALADADAVVAEAGRQGVALRRIGRTGGERLTVGGRCAISISELRTIHEAWLPAYMASAT